MLSLVAVGLAFAASVYWAFAPTNTVSTCSTAAQRDLFECSSTSETLLQSEGGSVIWLLAVPVALAAAIAALVAVRRARWLAWVLALVFWVACLVSLASIGLFYVPAAVASVVAVAVWVQGEPRP